MLEEKALGKIAEDLECHGGVSYISTQERGHDDRFSKEEWDNYYWLGWDYMHSGDFVPSHSKEMNDAFFKIKRILPKKWTLEDVEKEVHEVISSFKTLLKEQ